MKIHDISITIHPNMLVWPTDHKPRFGQWLDQASGDVATASDVTFSAHTGTHLDAPNHFIPGAPGVDSLPLDVLIGPAVVVDAGEAPALSAEVLAGLGIPPGTRRVLFRTANSRTGALQDAFRENYVGLTLNGARWLIERGVRLVGTDYLSVGSSPENIPTHDLLLRSDVVLLETLDLSAIRPGPYQLVALPLKLAGLDGSPARAVLIEQD